MACGLMAPSFCSVGTRLLRLCRALSTTLKNSLGDSDVIMPRMLLCWPTIGRNLPSFRRSSMLTDRTPLSTLSSPSSNLLTKASQS